MITVDGFTELWKIVAHMHISCLSRLPSQAFLQGRFKIAIQQVYMVKINVDAKIPAVYYVGLGGIVKKVED